MRFAHYTDRAVALAAELVNRFTEQGSGPSASAARDVLRDHGVEASRVTAADVEALRLLARDLRQVFTAADGPTKMAVLNAALAGVDVRPHISDHDERGPHLHFASPDADLAARVRANTLMGLAVVACDFGPERLGACVATGCDSVFVDVSRNAQRRFCSERCASRSNVAAHRIRVRHGKTT